MNLSEFMTRFRAAVGDTDGRFFDDDELIESINLGIEDLGHEARYKRKLAVTYAIQGVGVYKLPSDLAELSALPEYNGVPLRKLDTLQAQARFGSTWRDTEGTPTHYLRDERGEQFIRLYPKPAQDLPILTGSNFNSGATTVPIGSNDYQDYSDYFDTLDLTVDAPFMLAVFDHEYREDMELPYVSGRAATIIVQEDPNFEVIEVASFDGAPNITAGRGRLGTTDVDHQTSAYGPCFSPCVVDALRFNYIALATAVEDASDTLDLPLRAQRYLMHKVKADYYEKDGPHRNMDMVAFNTAKAEDELAKLVGRAAREHDRLPAYTETAMPEYL